MQCGGIVMSLGKIIKENRIKKKIKQAELAEMIGVNRSYISLIETDRTIPNDKTLEKIAKVLDINVDVLKFSNSRENEVIIFLETLTHSTIEMNRKWSELVSIDSHDLLPSESFYINFIIDNIADITNWSRIWYTELVLPNYNVISSVYLIVEYNDLLLFVILPLNEKQYTCSPTIDYYVGGDFQIIDCKLYADLVNPLLESIKNTINTHNRINFFKQQIKDIDSSDNPFNYKDEDIKF